MVAGGESFADATDPADLLRRYARALAAEPRMPADVIGDLRTSYAQAKHGLRASSRAAADLSTRQAWHKAFVNGTASHEQLRQACAHLTEGTGPAARTYGRMLDHHAAWIAARFDPQVPRLILQRIAQALAPGPTRPVDGGARELRLAAIQARRRHPRLETLAPGLFRALLKPVYKAGRVAASGSPASRPVGVGTRRPRQTSQSIPWWTWFLILWGATSLFRMCQRVTKDTEPPASRRIERLQEDSRKRLDDNLEWLKEFQRKRRERDR